MTVEQADAGSGLDSFLTIFDSDQHILTFNDDSNPAVTGFADNSLVQFSVTAGQTYYIEASAYANVNGTRATGNFTLGISTNTSPPVDVEPDSFAKAVPVDVSDGFARVSRAIDADTVVNVFTFIAPLSESVHVELDPSGADNFQGYLYAFDEAGTQLANDYNLSLLFNDTTSTVQFNVLAGHAYYVQVAAYRGRTGAFDLRFQAGPSTRNTRDASGGSFANPIQLDFDASGTALATGTIDPPGGVDVYRFQAIETQTLNIREFAAPGSRLDTVLISFTDSGSPLIQNDDIDVALTQTGALDHVIDRDSMIQLQVIAGKTYYLKAASAGSSTGSYILSLSPATDDFGDWIGDVYHATNQRHPVDQLPVQRISLSGTGSGTQRGVIDMPGDLDAFRFTATLTGVMTVSQQAAPGSSLDSQLFAFDAAREPLANNNDFYGSYNSLVQFNVVAGQTYYLKAGAYGASIGAYVLALNIEPPSSAPGHSFATAIPLTISATLPTRHPGTIVATGDADVYQFVAPASGLLTVTERATLNSPLDSLLYAFDGSQPINNFAGLQALLASNDDSGGTLDSLVQFNVTAGQTYFIRAAGFGTSIGDYILTLSYGGATPPDPVGHTFASAGTVCARRLGLREPGRGDHVSRRRRYVPLRRALHRYAHDPPECTFGGLAPR